MGAPRILLSLLQYYAWVAMAARPGEETALVAQSSGGGLAFDHDQTALGWRTGGGAKYSAVLVLQAAGVVHDVCSWRLACG
jgi:hypothetical protein